MNSELEDLAAELAVDGLSAWGRLYDQLSGKLEFELAVPGREVRSLPVSVARSLLEAPQPEVRRAALEGSKPSLGAGRRRDGRLPERDLRSQAHALRASRRSPLLDPALFDAGITRRTLDTLLEAVAARQEVARDYLRLKARCSARTGSASRT